MSDAPLPDAPRLLTLRESEKVLRASNRQIRGWVKDGRLPVVRFSDKPGSRLYFDLDDLRRFIAAHKTANGSQP